MTDRVRCQCPHCTIRGLLGPAVVVTVGVLFLLDQLRDGYLSLGHTFLPVILIVIGAISLGSALASTEGHVSGPVPPATTPPGAAPPSPLPPGPYAGRG